MSIALVEAPPMTRITPVMLDAAGNGWLVDRKDADRIGKAERIRALVVLARSDSAVAERAVEVADNARRADAGGPYTYRINLSLGADDAAWLTKQRERDRLNSSERIRALIVLARTDSAIAERAVKTADDLRRAKRGGE